MKEVDIDALKRTIDKKDVNRLIESFIFWYRDIHGRKRIDNE